MVCIWQHQWKNRSRVYTARIRHYKRLLYYCTTCLLVRLYGCTINAVLNKYSDYMHTTIIVNLLNGLGLSLSCLWGFVWIYYRVGTTNVLVNSIISIDRLYVVGSFVKRFKVDWNFANVYGLLFWINLFCNEREIRHRLDMSDNRIIKIRIGELKLTVTNSVKWTLDSVKLST